MLALLARGIMVMSRSKKPIRPRCSNIRRLIRVTQFLAFVLVAARLEGQSGSVPSTPCSYDACALRQEGTLVRRGLEGERVGKMGLFSATNLSSIVRGDSATAYANVFDREYRRGVRLMWLGFVVTEVPATITYVRLRSGRSFGTGDGLLLGTAVGGFVVSHFGGRSLKYARIAASKAIWWHNRELTK